MESMRRYVTLGEMPALHENSNMYIEAPSYKYEREQQVQLWCAIIYNAVVHLTLLSFKGYSLTDPWIVCNRCISRICTMKDTRTARIVRHISIWISYVRCTLSKILEHRIPSVSRRAKFSPFSQGAMQNWIKRGLLLELQ